MEHTKRIASIAENDQGDKVIKVVFPYDLTMLEGIRSVQGRHYYKNQDCWSIPLFTGNIDTLLSWKFTLDDKLDTYYKKSKIRMYEKTQIDIPGLKGKLYPFQNWGVQYTEEHNGRILNADEMGLGKAQPWDTKVLTPDGWKQMGELTMDDLIFGSDGKPHKINGIYDKGIKEIYKVTFSDKTSVKCCKDHLWTVFSARDKNIGWCGQVLSLKRLMRRELKTEKKSKANLYFIPILSAPIHFTEKKQYLSPYTMGALLGDGGLANGVRFSNMDEDIIERVTKEVAQIGFTMIKKKGNNVDFNIIQTQRKYRNQLFSFFKKYKLNTTSAYKYIPKIYKFGSIEQRIQLLQGLMDTDGYASSKSGVVQYSTISKRLCNDFQFLVESLGGTAKVKGYEHSYIYKGERRPAHYTYTITIALPNSINPFYCKRKQLMHLKRIKYIPSRAFTNIEYVKDDRCFCISVDTPDRLYITEHCILTHNTIESLAWLQLHRDKVPVIIICPAVSKLMWERAIHNWLPKAKVEMLSGRTQSRTTAEFLIINYDVASKWRGRLKQRDAQVLILDECHYIKNNNAKRTKAIKLIAKGIPHILALSGTPIENRPVEIYNAWQLVDPVNCPPYWSFTKRYCKRKKNFFGGWDVSGANHTEELHKILTGTIMLRRRKADVLKDLPAKVASFVPLVLHNKKDYNSAEADFIAYVKEVYGAKAADKKKKAVAVTKMEELKQLAAKGKLPEVIEWIKDFLEVEDKFVVFAWHTFVIDAIMEAFPKIAVRVDGKTKNKQACEDKFQNDPNCHLFVGQMKAAGVSLTLTASSNVGIIEYPWTPGTLNQAIDRVHRITQKGSVTVYYFMAQNTIDEKTAKVLDVKQKTIGAVIDGDECPEDTTLFEDLINEYFKKANIMKRTKFNH